MKQLLDNAIEDNMTLKMINLWEDALPLIRELPMKLIEIPNIAIVQDYNIVGLLSEMGIDPVVHYPIMRLNNMVSLNENTLNTQHIYIPIDLDLSVMRDELLKEEGV